MGLGYVGSMARRLAYSDVGEGTRGIAATAGYQSSRLEDPVQIQHTHLTDAAQTWTGNTNKAPPPPNLNLGGYCI